VNWLPSGQLLMQRPGIDLAFNVEPGLSRTGDAMPQRSEYAEAHV